MRTRLLGLAVMVLALAVAAVAVATAAWGTPETHVLLGSERPNRVDWVLPGGPEWQNGIRPGQTVIELSSGTEPRTWTLITTDGERSFAVSYLAIEASLRESLVGALFAALCGLVAFVVVRRLYLATAIAAVSLVISAHSLLATGMPSVSSGAAIGAIGAFAAWHLLWSRAPLGRRALIVGSGSFVATFWLIARFVVADYYDIAEIAREIFVVVAVIGTLVVLVDQRGWRARLATMDGARVADLFAIALVLAIVLAVAVVTEVPLLVFAVLVGVGVLVYPRLRRRLASTIDDVLLGELQSKASLRAVEEERGRIARDLHDEPLQEISAAIRELERRGGTEHEADLLRRAASHLRRVTTELRPPVLDDLGLAAAVAHVVEQATKTAPDIDFTSRITPDDPFAKRSPADVELAVFRIVQEAVENAMRHAGATQIKVNLDVSPTEVTAVVDDDGRGIENDAARKAVRNGHVGLASMAQRASLIGAAFETVGRQPHGTTVRVHWRGAR